MGFYGFSTRAIIGNIDSAVYAVLFSILAAATVVDIRERRIPDSMVIAGAMLGLTLKLYYPRDGFIDGLIGGATAGFVLLLIYL
ncbi:MAG TPA: prepilin peptidase, partial [Candidatus Nitrosocosmicus sp.]|nr:prepilin peptidase [Candidatus Nitrosocosmicus sp.]